MPSTTPFSVFEIHFDDNRTTFVPGQKIEGFIVFNVLERVKLSTLKIKFTGIISTKNEGLTNETSTITMFKEYADFLAEYLTLDDPDDPMNNTLTPGEYLYPFQFRVPPTNLPASFSSLYGCVKYQITAIAKKYRHEQMTVSHEISIPSTKDVQDADLQTLFKEEKKANTGSLFWKSGYFNVKVSVPKTGYTSEETVPLSLEIVNHSRFGLEIESVCLKQKVAYITVDRKLGPITEKIHKLNYSEKFSSDLREINRLIMFPIPGTTVIDPDITTSILKVTHSIHIKMKSFARFSKQVKFVIPICIAGFPYLLFEEAFLRSVDTLPLYLGASDENTADANTNALENLALQLAHGAISDALDEAV